jgi:LemA protein
MSLYSDRQPYPARSQTLDPGVRQLLLLFLFVAAMLAFWLAACTYDVIPSLEEAAKARWTDLRNAYQWRLDLIPNLAATAQEVAKPEKDALAAVVEASAQAAAFHIDASQLTDTAKLRRFDQAQQGLSRALGHLWAVVATDPDLKANAPFEALKSQLESAEKRIGLAQYGYFEAAWRHEIALRAFPTVLWAKTLFAGRPPFAKFDANETLLRSVGDKPPGTPR